MENNKYQITYEGCPHCYREVQLESKFKAQVCPNCNRIILPCSICQVSNNCLNCPLDQHSVEDVYNEYFNKILEGTGYTACFVETSELYGEDDDKVDKDGPYYMMPIYEAHIEDENEDELDGSLTGRYCDALEVMLELKTYISELLDKEKEQPTNQNEEKPSVWLLEQYDRWFSCGSRVPFGVFSSREKAIEAMHQNYSKEALGEEPEFYENGTNQWMSDVLSCGIKICEIELDKFEEL